MNDENVTNEPSEEDVNNPSHYTPTFNLRYARDIDDENKLVLQQYYIVKPYTFADLGFKHTGKWFNVPIVDQ